MLSKINRLKKQKDIERVFKQGEGIREDFLFLKFVKNNLMTSRFAFIVSLKVSKKAILRNKIKRRLRELVKSRLSKIKKGYDIVLTAVPGLETKDLRGTEEIINKLFKKAKLIWLDALFSSQLDFISCLFRRI